MFNLTPGASLDSSQSLMQVLRQDERSFTDILHVQQRSDSVWTYFAMKGVKICYAESN